MVGEDDTSSNSHAIAQYDIYVDDQLRFSQQVAFGSAVPFSLDVTGALRVRLAMTYAYSGSNDYDSTAMVFGDPAVTCSQQLTPDDS